MTAPVVLTQDHCSGCGDLNPDAPGGYTGCCNEPVCNGCQPACADTWATGSMDDHVQTGTIRACCAPVAESALPGVDVALWRIR
jgi:hypothetical protein